MKDRKILLRKAAGAAAVLVLLTGVMTGALCAACQGMLALYRAYPPLPPFRYRAPILLGVGLVIVLLVHLTGWLLARRKLFRNKLTGSLLAAAAVGIGMILLRLIVFH